MEQAPEVSSEELKVFLQEVDEQLQLLDEDIIRLEKEEDNVDLLQEIFRAAHTLKGSSSMLGFHKMADLTHVMEDVLDRLRKGLVQVTPELIDALLASLDELKILKQAISSGGDDSAGDIAPLVAMLKNVVQPGEEATSSKKKSASISSTVLADPAIQKKLKKVAAAGSQLYMIQIAVDPESAWAAVRFFQALNELGMLGEIICSDPSQEEIEQEKAGAELQVLLATAADADAVRAAVSSIEDITGVEVAAWSEADAASDERVADQEAGGDDAEQRVIDLGLKARGKSPREQLELASQKIETLQTVRIEVDQLDALLNVVGELVTERTRVSAISRVLERRYRGDETVQSLAETCDRLVRGVTDLNEGMMRLRMLPIGTLFNKFPRLLRDVARATGKDVDLVLAGEDTEIDRSVIEKIKDPLVHLLRNAVDHGVETPEERRAAGKPVPAVIKLSANHEQGHIIITLEDDGKGIDAKVMRASAVKKGLMTAEAAERLSDAEAVDLIFESGFSTAAKTTEVSGRGVGMDVVRKNISAVNGIVKIDTAVGRGTTITLQLPLTLATFRGLLVESAGAVYAIPLNYVQETSGLDSSAIESILDIETVRRSGTVMPLLRLSSVCDSGPKSGQRKREAYIVVVKAGDWPVAIAVDALMEQQEIVVKSLGKYMGQTEGISGASILGNGQVVLIVDVVGIIKAMQIKRRAA